MSPPESVPDTGCLAPRARWSVLALALAVVGAGCEVPATDAPRRQGPNETAERGGPVEAPTAGVRWRGFEEGSARARAEHKPLCLVLEADWCPHCRNYHQVFEDPRVIAQSRSFVMVRLNVDHEPAIAERFQLDGTYVPRTYFLAPDGSVMAAIDAQRPRYRYFFNESDPSGLLAAMTSALAAPR